MEIVADTHARSAGIWRALGEAALFAACWLLAELARQDGRIVRREDLYEHVWGVPLRNGDRTIDVYVRKLRVIGPFEWDKTQ